MALPVTLQCAVLTVACSPVTSPVSQNNSQVFTAASRALTTTCPNVSPSCSFPSVTRTPGPPEAVPSASDDFPCVWLPPSPSPGLAGSHLLHALPSRPCLHGSLAPPHLTVPGIPHRRILLFLSPQHLTTVARAYIFCFVSDSPCRTWLLSELNR